MKFSMKTATAAAVGVFLSAAAHAQDQRADIVMEADPGLPLHTIYAPRASVEKLGIVVWGNGGCLNDGSNYQDVLSEVAAHGFLVIANGAPAPRSLDNDTTAAQLLAALDWAFAESERAGGKYAGKLDTAQVAAMGHSCGGRQALTASADPRVKTSIILNAGASAPETLTSLHGPILLFSGGPSDRAHRAVGADFAAIGHVPAIMVELDVGHNGTLFDERGGAFGRVIVRWLAWRLKGSGESASWFVGENCTLCTVPAWTIARKKIE